MMLWQHFLSYIFRFNDIEVSVRQACVAATQGFIVYHPELVPEITEQLNSRCYDPDENVRHEVVAAIMKAAKIEINNITDDLLKLVKDRTLDKKVRKSHPEILKIKRKIKKKI